MILRYSARAKTQLLELHAYLVERGDPGMAVRVGTRLREATEILRSFPHAGRPGRVAGTREWVVRQLPSVIV